MAEQHDDERSGRSNRGDDRRSGSSGGRGGDRGRREGDRRSRPARGDRDGRSERRSYGDRDNRGERRSYGDRDNRDRKPYGERSDRGERRPYGDRDNRSERRTYGDRDNRGERKPYGDRDNRDRKPYGDRNDRGERSDRGDRRPYGERDSRGRKPYGDRNDRSDRGERRPYGDRDSHGERRSYGDRDSRSERRPYGDRDSRDRKPYRSRDDRGERRSYGDRDNRGERRPYGERSDRNHAQRGGRDREAEGMPDLRPVRERFRAPELPTDVKPEELDGIARMQLKTLQKENADTAAMHLAMTARLIDEDPELAHQHALAASRTAGRIGVVRETLGITAYTTGDFALALRELRTYRRITGNDDQLPLMVDCERGLGRPEKALELARSVDAAKLDAEVRVELAIAKSGARLDLGQAQEALEELRIPELDRTRAFDYSPALFAAHATVLEELGRAEESAEWFALSDKAVDALENAYLARGTEEVSIEEESLPEAEDAESQPEDEALVDDADAGEPMDAEASAEEPAEPAEPAEPTEPVQPAAEPPAEEAAAAESVAETASEPAESAPESDEGDDDIALFDFKED